MSQLNHDLTFWIVGGSKTGSPSLDPKPYSTANYKGFNIFLHQGIFQIADTSSRIHNNQTLTDPYLDAAGVSAKPNVSRDVVNMLTRTPQILTFIAIYPLLPEGSVGIAEY